MADETTTQNNTVIGQENEHGIKVFGEATATPQTETDVDNKETDVDIKAKELEANAKEQEAVKQKADDEKPKADDKADDLKNDAPKTDKKEDDKPKEGLKFDFGGSDKEKPKDTPKETDDKKQETVSVTNDVVIDYLQKNGFESIKELSDLSKPDALPEQVEKFKKFHEETGRGINDFYNLQKDWKSETSESRIKEFLKLKYPDLNEEQIETQFNVVKVTEEDEETLSPRELSRVKAEFDKMDSDAVAFLSSKSKEYQVPLENAKQEQAKPPSKEDVAKAHRPYWDARDKSLKEFNEFSFKIEGLGEIKIPIDEDDKKALSQRTETLDTMVGSWRKDDNSLNTDLLLKENAFGISSIFEKAVKSIAEQVHTLTLEQYSKQNRNVDLDDLNKEQKTKNNNNGDMVVFEDSNNKKDSQSFGQPIFTPRP